MRLGEAVLPSLYQILCKNHLHAKDFANFIHDNYDMCFIVWCL